MDQQRDFANFRKLMARLCETMDKPITDELVESWWKALRSVSFADVQKRIESFLERAGERTRFPRPGMFRPEDQPASDPRDEARERRAVDENQRNWQAFCRRYPYSGPIKLKMAHAARVLATTHESTAAHSEALAEYHHLENLLGGRFAADR